MEGVKTYRAKICRNIPPASIYIGAGTTGDTVSDMAVFHDGNIFHLVEASGVPGIDLVIEFHNVPIFRGMISLDWYDGSATHFNNIQFLNVNRITYSGMADSATVNTLVDAALSLSSNELRSCRIVTTGGTGLGQTRRIENNTSSTALLITENWDVIPDDTTTYEIFTFDDWDICQNKFSYAFHNIEIPRSIVNNYIDDNNVTEARYFHPTTGSTQHNLYINGINLVT